MSRFFSHLRSPLPKEAEVKPSDLLPLPVQLLQSALGTVQSSKIQLGRSLSLDVTPRSQTGASSAEIDSPKVDDVASPTYYSAKKSSGGLSVDVSHVAQHDTQIHVRVDSIKLFEISSFSAVLSVPGHVSRFCHGLSSCLTSARSPACRSLPPRSTTAADSTSESCLPTGQDDLPCRVVLRKAQSLTDFADPIQDFHRTKINCIADDHPYARLPAPLNGMPTQPTTTPVSCSALTFDKVIHDLE